ncbi:MAG TPA: hypothetical protein DEG47_07815, partial [Cyanobacteria bacterium UBA11148]|nr:hypothetical protein [Cyanobacteria bacterium UBA11148]
LQAQLEKASKFGYNGLDVPVNTPSTPSPRIQRKLTLDGLDNQYQPEVIERANPVLNGLHQFKIQRQPQTTERTDRRTDRRTERETESDRRRRRPAGGRERDRREGGDLDSDWAGRMILYRYLTGGGDWQINNDPQWTAYMTANASLTSQIRTKLLLKAQNLCSRGSSDQSFYESFPIAIENGEGIIGYQYLHGTNADVGGFGMGGTAEITRNQGRCTVKFNLSYTWNDIIDPNPQYDTDTLKSLFAEIITFGQAQAYVIRITWNQETVVTLKETGSLIAIQGWPGN